MIITITMITNMKTRKTKRKEDTHIVTVIHMVMVILMDMVIHMDMDTATRT